MSLESKVVWSEGMFLNPHHFQQQERYLERYINGKCDLFGSHGWGVSRLDIDSDLLKLGKISINGAAGIFPDGTPFEFPDFNQRPDVREVSPNTNNQLVYLALPVKRAGAIDILSSEESQGLARFFSQKQALRDVAFDGGETIDVDIAQPKLRILLASEDTSGYVCIPIGRIVEVRDDKNILLDDEFIASCIDTRVSSKINGFLSELVGLLHHRAQSIAGRLADVARGGTAEVADYMMLQMLNRLEPLAKHLSEINGLHPVDLYREIIQMSGEFSTFVTENKRPQDYPPYLHNDLQATFAPVMNGLRQSLSMVYEQTAIAMPLVEKKYGIRVAQITDATLVNDSLFVLAVKADLPENTIRSQLPAQIKIGSVERIRQLVNAAIPGITIRPMSQVPRQIPYRTGTTYFELERHSDFWKELQHSGGFAFHIGGDFPGIELEFWAIRQS